MLMLIALVTVAACSDDEVQRPREVDFCVRALWQDGLADGRTTRALSATNLLADVTSNIEISTDDYPDEIRVVCKKDATEVFPFTLTKRSASCSEHAGYWQYTPDFLFRDQLIRREDYTFHASAVIDDDGDPLTTNDGDRLEGVADEDDIDGTHMLLTLHHTKALLRFAFKVSEKYDKIRYIKVTGIKLNDAECYVKDVVLNKDNMTLIGYAYVDPTVVTISNKNTIECTYNVYDKDAVFPTASMTSSEIAAANTELRKHLDREGVVAKNTFKLNGLKDASDNNVAKIQAGYYYDLRVTLNPDYLYVLSDHDEKHLTIELNNK